MNTKDFLAYEGFHFTDEGNVRIYALLDDATGELAQIPAGSLVYSTAWSAGADQAVYTCLLDIHLFGDTGAPDTQPRPVVLWMEREEVTTFFLNMNVQMRRVDINV